MTGQPSSSSDRQVTPDLEMDLVELRSGRALPVRASGFSVDTTWYGRKYEVLILTSKDIAYAVLDGQGISTDGWVLRFRDEPAEPPAHLNEDERWRAASQSTWERIAREKGML